MKLNTKTLSITAALSLGFGSMGIAGSHDVCNTPSKLGDMGSFPGEVITMQGSMLGTDQEMLENTISCFEKATGAKVQYSGSRDFAALVVADMRSNNPPNISIFPQPGLAADMAAEGHLIPIGDEAAAWMKDNYGAGSSWVDLGTYKDPDGNDQFYGFAFKMDLKSLVWYSPEQFEDNGYEIPSTMEELIALSDQMVADGNTPWCIGVESGNATGWTATDWMEDIMLRTTSAENYDRWVSNDLAFNSPEVINAMELYGQFSRELTIKFHSINNFWTIEGQVIRNPTVIVFSRGSTQHDVFHPVGCGPTCSIPRLDTNTPGCISISYHLI